MKQSKLNLVIDAITLIVMMAIIGIGLSVKYVLLTGQENGINSEKILNLH